MPYTFDPVFAVDPQNPSNVAKNASITIFDPADATQAPITITDPTGVPLENPMTLDAAGMGPAYQHATLARVGWKGAGFVGYFTSYEGMLNETLAAKVAAIAAQTAAETAGIDAADVAAGALAGAVADATAAKVSAEEAAALVNAPADSAIAAALAGTGQAAAVISTTYATQASLAAAVFDSYDVNGVAAAPPNALARLRAALAHRNAKPVVIVGAGSSTMNGTAAASSVNKLQNQLTTKFQTAYPLSSGTATPVRTLPQAVAAQPLTNGVQFVNAAIGGTMASNYLTSSTRADIASLKPSVIMHMVSSNDYKQGTPVPTFKSTLQGQLDSLDALLTEPCVHILFQPHERFDPFTPVAEYAEYGVAMAEIARTYPDRVAYIDLSQSFEAIGIPGDDPYGFMAVEDPYGVHLNDAGQTFLADLVYDGLTQNITLGNPNVTASIAPPPGPAITRFTSDSFSAADGTNPHGTNTDAALGGTAQAWTGSTTAYFQTLGGKLVRGASTGAATLHVQTGARNDVLVGAKFEALPSVVSFLSARRSAAGSSTASQYRVEITSTTARLCKTIAGTTIVYIGTSTPVVNGDHIAIKCVGSTISLVINGTTIEDVTDTDITVGGSSYSGFAVGALATFTIDDFTIDTVG